MKKIFLIGAVAAFMAGCNSDSKSDVETKKEIVSDTAAQYQNSVNTDTAKIYRAFGCSATPGKNGNT